MKTEGLDFQKVEEVSVPMGIEDFDPGDRVWFENSKTFSKVFGTIVSVNRQNPSMAFRNAKQEYAIITNDWDTTTAGYPPVSEFKKSIDVSSLSVGDRLSKSMAWGNGFVSRIYAVVTSVNPGKSVGVTREKDIEYFKAYSEKVPVEQLIKEQENGDTIEYQMAEWELEP